MTKVPGAGHPGRRDREARGPLGGRRRPLTRCDEVRYGHGGWGAGPSEETAMAHRKIRDVMTTDVATVTADARFKEMVRVMAERRVSALPVLDAKGRVADGLRS